MKKNYEEIVKNYEPQIPKKFYSFVFRFLFYFVTKTKKVKYIYNFDTKELKGKQVCLLADHASHSNFYFVLSGYPFVTPNCMMGYQNLFDKYLFKLFLKSGVIPKYLYVPDMKSTKSVFRLIKQGASICIFPEGIQSVDGSTHPMNPATLKLVKKLNMDIILCHSRGAYLAKPRFNNKFRKGPMEFEYSILFKKEELDTLTLDEMYDRFIKYFRYNDFKLNEEKQYEYIGKEGNAIGLENILYCCPKCGSVGRLKSSDDCIECLDCHNKIYVDTKYNIKAAPGSYLPYKRIDLWYKSQRKKVLEEIKNPEFRKEYNVTLKEIHFDKLQKHKNRYFIVGEGKLIITKEEVKYIGTRREENIELDFLIKNIPSAPILAGKGNEFYYNDKYYQFGLIDNTELATEIMLTIEELHNEVDPNWNKYSRDAYDCED